MGTVSLKSNALNIVIPIAVFAIFLALVMRWVDGERKIEALQQGIVRQVELHDHGWRALVHTEPGPSIWLDTRGQYLWPGRTVWIGLVHDSWAIVPESKVYEGIPKNATAPRPPRSTGRVRSTGGTGAGE